MTKLGPLVLLTVAACATPKEPPPERPEHPWSEEVGGLRCRVQVPSSAMQGDLLRTRVDLGVVRLHNPLNDGIRISSDLRTRGRSIELDGPNGRVVVRTYEPDSGMPPDGADFPLEVTHPGYPLTETIAFPLARAWDELRPGDYLCRVRLVFEPVGTGRYRGTLVSPEFPLRVDPAPPSEETFLLPKTLRVVETTFTTRDEGVETTIPVRQVVYGREDAEEVRLPRRNGFFLGTNLLRDGEMYGSLGGSTIEPDGANPIDASYGTGSEAQKLGAAYTIVIFETADAPEHMWHPHAGSGGYRELWRRTIQVTRVTPPR